MKMIPSIFCLSILSACGVSPLLHHEDAAPSTAVTDAIACALQLPTQKLCASVTWLQTPSADSKGRFLLRFWKKDEGTEGGPYVTPAHEVFVKLWMPSMGHGSSPVTLVQTRENDGGAIPGVFEVSDVLFIMRGKWEIRIQLRDGTRVLDQAIFPLEI